MGDLVDDPTMTHQKLRELQAEIEKLKAERDELLEALKLYVEWHTKPCDDALLGDGGTTEMLAEALLVARAAIAKAEAEN